MLSLMEILNALWNARTTDTVETLALGSAIWTGDSAFLTEHRDACQRRRVGSNPKDAFARQSVLKNGVREHTLTDASADGKTISDANVCSR